MLSGYEVTERNLVDRMLSAEEIMEIADSLQVAVHELLRPNSPIYKEQKEQLLEMNERELASFMSGEPTLIKRPIILTEKGYVLGLDEEKIRELLKSE